MENGEKFSKEEIEKFIKRRYCAYLSGDKTTSDFIYNAENLKKNWLDALLQDSNFIVNKPHLNKNHFKFQTLESVDAYRVALIEYQEKLTSFEKYKQVKRYFDSFFDEVVKICVKRASDLETIPEQYRQKLFDKIYSKYRSDGWYSVYEALQEWIEIFD